MIFSPGGNIHVLNAAGVYLLKVNYEYDRRNCGIYSKLTIKIKVSFGVSKTQKQPPEVFF